MLSNPRPNPDRLPEKGAGALRGFMYREPLAFDDPENRHPAVDRPDGFRSGGLAFTVCRDSDAGLRNHVSGMAL